MTQRRSHAPFARSEDSESAHASRRQFIRVAALGAGSLLAAPLLDACRSVGRTFDERTAQPPDEGVWLRVPEILRRIVPPSIPSRDFEITRHGAKPDGITDCTAAFRAAIDACNAAGGGRVVVPAGRFLTGPIHLKSNVNLHVERDGTIAFLTDPARYLPAVFTRFEGVELMGYSPLIYAFEQQNIAITGEGTLDGQASDRNWWPWKGSKDFGWTTGAPRQNEARERLLQMAEAGVPVAQRVFGEGSFMRPMFIQPYRCRNVFIEGVTIVSSPMWEIHPVLCTNVTVRGVKIASLGPNNDGCDPESCRDVLIENCTFNTGDDCIAIKSGRNADGRRVNVASENIIVRGCRMLDGHGGVTIGSEISGGVRYVFAEKCEMNSPRLDRALRIKNNAARGGLLEHIYMRDVTIGQVAESVLAVDFLYEEGANGAFVPIVRDVELRTVRSGKSTYALYLRSFPKAEISDVRVIDCTFDNVAKPSVTEGVANLVVRNTRINGSLVS